MLLLARRNLLVHKGRFLLAIAGITCSVVLVLLLMGLYAGWRDNMAAYLRHVHADLWVGQKGAYDLFHTLSLLPTLGEQPLPLGLTDAELLRDIGLGAWVGCRRLRGSGLIM